MDDLTFRRAVYADPTTRDPEIINAAKQDPEKQNFWNDILAMESDINAAVNVSVPENLSDKLLLMQTLSEHRKQKKQHTWYVAFAASILLVVTVSVSLYRTGPTDIVSEALAHVEHVDAEVAKYGPVDMQSVNLKLAQYNGKIYEEIGNILSANYCYLHNLKSLHLIIQNGDNLLSLFVMPDDKTNTINPEFSNDAHIGKSFSLESARVVVVGTNEDAVGRISEKAQKYLKFSA